jgi:hypothetical protein
MRTDESFLIEVLDRAKGEPTKFDQIHTWQEYFQLQITACTLKALIKVLNRTANKLFKKYCKTVKTRSAEVKLLYAYREFALAACFYEKELQNCKNTIYTFEDALISRLWG